MNIEEFIHIIFGETNSKLVEVEMFDYVGILKNTLLEDKNQYQDKEKNQDQYQNKYKDNNKDQDGNKYKKSTKNSLN